MNILVTNYNNSGTDVLVIINEPLSLNALSLATALSAQRQTYDDVYYVKPEEMQYYLFEPLFADKAFIDSVKTIAEKHKHLTKEIAQKIGYVPERS